MTDKELAQKLADAINDRTGARASLWTKYGKVRVYINGSGGASGYYEIKDGAVESCLSGYGCGAIVQVFNDFKESLSASPVTEHSNLTSEKFEELCGGAVQAAQVTREMLDLASTIRREEASQLLRMPSSSWHLEPTIAKIEESIDNCRDRQVQAVLTVATFYGDDGWNDRV